jgi:hypothetical protein
MYRWASVGFPTDLAQNVFINFRHQCCLANTLVKLPCTHYSSSITPILQDLTDLRIPFHAVNMDSLRNCDAKWCCSGQVKEKSALNAEPTMVHAPA